MMSPEVTDGTASVVPQLATMTNSVGGASSDDATMPSRRQPTTKRRAAASAALAALGTVALLNAVSFGGLSGGLSGGRTRKGGSWGIRRLLSKSTRRRLCASGSALRISRRLEEELCEASTPYVSKDDMDELAEGADIPSPRAVPSHIALCRELITRHALVQEGGTPEGTFGIEEDEALCLDWKAPTFAMEEIWASTIIARSGDANGLGLTYKHKCRETLPSEKERLEQTRNMDTVQQHFASSSLVLDDQPVPFDAVQKLCNGCISEFDNGGWDAYADAHDKLAHHCFLYPGSEVDKISAVTFDDTATEDDIDAQRREMAQAVPLGAVLTTVQDRMRITASTVLSQIGSPLPKERQSGVVIPLDKHSGVLPAATYADAIGDGVTSIQILSTANCATAFYPNGVSCLEHGQALKKELSKIFDTEVVEIRHDIVASTAAAFSRMILCHLLISPPGTVASLIPALTKEEGTFAKVFEGSRWPLTWKFFNVVRQYRSNIIVIDLDAPEKAEFVQGGTIIGGEGITAAAGSTTTEGVYAAGGGGTEAGATTFSGAVSNNAGVANSASFCIDNTARAGSWEMEWDYDDLARMNVQGTNKRGVNGERHGQPAGGRLGAQGRSAAGAGGAPAMWNDDLCEVHQYTRAEICVVLGELEIEEIHFVGDYASVQQIQALLRDMEIGQTQIVRDADGNFVKMVGCEGPPRFAVRFVFVNNALLDVEGSQQQVFDPNAGAAMTTNNGPQYVNTAGPGVTGTYYQGGVRQPVQQYVNQQQAPVQYMASAPMMPAVMPMMSAMPMAVPYAGTCTCSPWTQGYQQPAAGQPSGPGGRRLSRKLLVAGMGASDQAEDLEAHKAHFNNFRRLAETVSSPRDIVVYRTTPPEHSYCDIEGGGKSRRLAPARGLNSRENIREFNRHAKHSIHEMKRRHLSSPTREGRARFHILDVERITASHPDATPEGMSSHKCEAKDGRVSDIHTHWNGMLLGMLKNIGKEEKMQANVQQGQAPQQAQAIQIPPQAQAVPQQAQAPQVQPQAQAAPQQAQGVQVSPQAQALPQQQAQAPQVPPQAQAAPQQAHAVQVPPQAQAAPQQAHAVQVPPQAQALPQQQAQAPQVPPQAQASPQRAQAPPRANAPLQAQVQAQAPAKPEDQPATSGLVHDAWEKAMHAAAVEKQNDPGHRVVSPVANPQP